MTKTLVQINGTDIIGELYDYNEKFAQVATERDIFVVKINEITEITPIVEFDNEFEKAMSENGIEFDGYTDGENVSYMIDGFTYSIDVYLDFESGIFALETLHKGKEDDDSRDWANRKEYKKLSTLIKNTLKWTDK